jgi:WD40 repeat protein
MCGGFTSTLQAQTIHFQLQKVLEGFDTPVIHIRYSNHGKFLALGTAQNTIQLLDSTFRELWTFHSNPLYNGGLIAFTPQEDYLVFGNYHSTQDLALLRLSDRQIVQHLLTSESQLNSLAISPDGQWLVAGGNGTNLKLWRWNKDHFDENETLDLSKQNITQVLALDFSPDSRRLAIAGMGQELILVELKRQSWQIEQSFNLKNSSYSVVFHPEGEYFVAGGANELHIFKMGRRNYDRIVSQSIWGGSLEGLSFTIDGEWLTSTQEGGLRVHRFKNGALNKAQELEVGRGWGLAVTFSPNTMFHLLSTTDRKVWIHKVHKQTE